MFRCAQYCRKSMCYLNQLIIVLVYDEIFRTKLYLRPKEPLKKFDNIYDFFYSYLYITQATANTIATRISEQITMTSIVKRFSPIKN